ncbi:16974_t:CDS:1, partial [Acaulospora colombiana]
MPVTEDMRRRNLEQRRRRMLASGIDEEAEMARARRARRPSVEEVIVISDEDEDEDRFRTGRASQRERMTEGELEKRDMAIRSLGSDDFQWSPISFLAVPPGRLARARNMHQHSVQLDRARLEGRVRAHLNGLVDEQANGYVDLFGGWRGVVGQIRDAFTHIGWGPPIATRWGLEETFLGPEPPSEEREIDLPDAPEYQTSFTHPRKAIPGFTSEFAPLEIVDLDSDDEYDP